LRKSYELQKQHIVSKTYLKHFSPNSDGKSLFLIDHEAPHQKGIQCKNSGDSVFWEKNYSDSPLFKDKKIIEKIFGQDIEPGYNAIIKEIEAENEALSFETKQKIIQWIFYTKRRSPIWEPFHSPPAQPSESRYTQQRHLENFTDEDRFKAALDGFIRDAVNKRWTIYRSPKDNHWWTSDNPGYCIDCADLTSSEALQAAIPDPYCRLSGPDAVLFYPLSKKYCLSIQAYDYGEDVRLNATNTKVDFVQADESMVKYINYWTLISQARLVISADKDSLKPVEQIKLSSGTR
jgi:hypothetical protein